MRPVLLAELQETGTSVAVVVTGSMCRVRSVCSHPAWRSIYTLSRRKATMARDDCQRLSVASAFSIATRRKQGSVLSLSVSRDWSPRTERDSTHRYSACVACYLDRSELCDCPNPARYSRATTVASSLCDIATVMVWEYTNTASGRNKHWISRCLVAGNGSRSSNSPNGSS